MKRKNYFNSLISFSCAFSGPSTGAGPNSSQAVHRPVNKTDSSEKVASHARKLQQEVDQLRKKLAVSSEQREYKKCKPLLITPRIDMTKWRSLENEEKTLREENVRLQRKLNMEVERREALHRQLSESETSLEMEEERYCIFIFFLCFIKFFSDFNQGSFPRTQPGRSNSPFYPSQIQNFIPNPVSAFTPPSPRSGPAAVQVPQVTIRYRKLMPNFLFSVRHHDRHQRLTVS